MSYEFNDEDEKVINSVSWLGITIAGLIAIRGIIDLIDTLLLKMFQSTELIVLSSQSFLQIISGLVFIPAALSFRRITTTEGQDISEFIDGIDRMAIAFFIIIVLIAISAILDVVLIAL